MWIWELIAANGKKQSVYFSMIQQVTMLQINLLVDKHGLLIMESHIMDP